MTHTNGIPVCVYYWVAQYIFLALLHNPEVIRELASVYNCTDGVQIERTRKKAQHANAVQILTATMAMPKNHDEKANDAHLCE